MVQRARTRRQHFLGEPRGDERHLEGVGVRVQGVKRVRAHGAKHQVHATRELRANWKKDAFDLFKTIHIFGFKNH